MATAAERSCFRNEERGSAPSPFATNLARVNKDGDALIGRSLGGYRLEMKLGTGATGVVFRGVQEGTKAVAIKVLNENLGSISALKRRFEREAKVLAKLRHPNIVDVLEFGVSPEGLTYIVMELLEGRNLEQFLDDAPIQPAYAIEVLREVLKGLAFAHQRQIVHRDLKPANVFLCGEREKTIKLLDFGLAKMLSDDDVCEESTLTRRGRIVGTPAYMAPEQIVGVGLDVRADVYAAGILLFELLADRRPFTSENRSELLRAHLLLPPPTLHEARAELDAAPALEALIARALAKAPEARYRDGAEFLEALEALPPDCAQLIRVKSDAPRSRATASSEVISAEERQRASASMSESAPAPPLLTYSAHESSAESIHPSTPPLAATMPSVIVKTGPATGSIRTEKALPKQRADTTDRYKKAPVPKKRAISTPTLYLIAVMLFGIAVALWMLARPF